MAGSAGTHAVVTAQIKAVATKCLSNRGPVPNSLVFLFLYRVPTGALQTHKNSQSKGSVGRFSRLIGKSFICRMLGVKWLIKKVQTELRGGGSYAGDSKDTLLCTIILLFFSTEAMYL